jgi:hypothetical protein
MNAPQLSSFQDGHADQLFGNDLNHQRTTIEHESLQRRLQYPQNPQYQNQQQQMQQQQYYENQPQQQFEQNVQSIFGIGQSQPNDEVMGSNTINNMNNFYDGGYYGPFTAANTKDVNTSAFLTALCLNAVVFAVLLGSYELFRRWFPSVYSPKSSTDGGRRTSASLSGAPSPSRNKNAESTPAVNINTRLPLGWIPGVARTSWSTVRSSGGLDSYMFLRYVRLCFRVTATSAIWACIILMPVFATGGSEAKGWYYLSMANLLQGSSKMWIPTAFIWLQTLYVLFVMNEEYKHYFDCRVDFLARGDGMVNCQQHMYSLIVERIPYELRSDRALYDYFNRLFPRKVHSTAVVLNLPDMERVKHKRQRVLRRLEKSTVSLEVRGRRPTHVVGRKRVRCCGIESAPVFSSFGGKHVVDDDSVLSDNRMPQRGEKVDSINYYNRELAVIDEKLLKMQHEKIELAQKGNDSVRASQWISHAIDRVSTAAESTLVGCFLLRLF